MISMTNKRGGIVRVNKRANSYTVLDTYFLSDARLSWKAKGLLGYLLSKPDNWRVYVTDLVKRAKDGRDSVYSGIRELEENGYIERHQIRDEKGRISHMETVVYERPLVDGNMPPTPPGSDESAMPIDDDTTENESINEPEDESTDTTESVKTEPNSPLTENPLTDKPNLETATLSINDLSNIDFKVIDRLSAREETGNTNKKTSKDKSNTEPTTTQRLADLQTPILEALSVCLRDIPVNDTVTLYDFYFDDIFAALCRHFGDHLEPEIIRKAGDIYVSRTIDERTFRPKIDVYNPPGLFVEAYKDAINGLGATRWREARA